MANRGSFSYVEGMPIYGIKVTYGDGSVAWKMYPSRSGLLSGITSTKSDMRRWGDQPWGVKNMELFSTIPEWFPFDEDEL